MPQPPLGLRVGIILLLGAALLLLSSLMHAAAAAWTSTAWPSLPLTWLVAAIVIAIIVLGAASARSAWSRLCLVNGLASGLVLLASLLDSAALGQGLVETGEQMTAIGLSPSIGAALGAALLSGLLGIAAFVLLSLFLVFFYIFGRSTPRHHQLG